VPHRNPLAGPQTLLNSYNLGGPQACVNTQANGFQGPYSAGQGGERRNCRILRPPVSPGGGGAVTSL